MKRVMVKKLNEMAKALGIIGGFLFLGAAVGQVVNFSNVKKPEIGFIAVAVDHLNLVETDTVMSRVEGDALDEEKQARLDWLFKSKTHEVSQEVVYEQLKTLGYQVKLVDELINIPAAGRTSSIQQQLFRGAEYVVVDHEAKTIWCEYEAPENMLTEAVLSID